MQRTCHIQDDFVELPFNDRKRRYIDRDSFSHNSPGNRARKVFKPSTISASLLVSTEFFFQFWVRGSLWVTY